MANNGTKTTTTTTTRSKKNDNTNDDKYKYNATGPWEFRGKALYQLHLVKASDARRAVPSELELVTAFGYTLGGVYVARYDDSPCGAFDEMVVLGGLVWNKPLSCAWASRVYVNNEEARKHGVKTCGLPSRRADFTAKKDDDAGKEETSTQQPSGITGRRRKKKELRSAATILFPGFRFVNAPPRTETPTRPDSFFSDNNTNRTHRPWWRHKEEDGKEKEEEKGGERSSSSNTNNSNNSVVVVVQEKKNAARCAMRLPMEPKKIVAPRIKMFLPSFSGRTKTCPDLMKYSLEMNANVRVSKPIEMCDHGDGNTEDAKKRKKNRGDDVLTGVLKGKPVVCIAFENMHMSVQKPVKFDVV